MSFGMEYSEMKLMLMVYQIYVHEYKTNEDTKAASVRCLVPATVPSVPQSVANS